MVNFLKEKYGRDLEKNLIKMVKFYMKENIQMEKDMEKEKNFLKMVY